MIRSTLVLLWAAGLLTPLVATARPAGPPTVVHAPKVHDLPAIRSSHVLRVLVNQTRNSSAEVKGQPIGVEYPRLAGLEKYLNSRPGQSKTGQIHLKIIPRPKEQLFIALQRGEGDLVAPGELMETTPPTTVTATAPVQGEASLVLVGEKGGRHLGRVEQLSGHTVTLARGSAAGEAIAVLNGKLLAHRQAPVKIEWVDPSLAAEDVLDMVQAGIYPQTVVERSIAERWLKIMPKLRIDARVSFPGPTRINWYVRSDAVQLKADLDQFLLTYKAPADADSAFKRAYSGLYQVHNPLRQPDRQRLEQLRPLLQRNAREQHMDWLDLAALAFKESALDSTARGGSGATGLMQMTPAAAQRVGVSNIQSVDNNVQASARYLAMIRQKFFSSRNLDERERMAFVLAAYNMGPERVQALRAEARRRGLNPNKWFFQVERVAMEQMGMNAVNYVNSVNKYYLAYDRERDSLEPQSRKQLASIR
ncbi:transglycosylase SLT domain-containing protein [Pseudomonas sp. dw_358]|uniref:transglycosylase SLT domain-containing protein n=1 Tax=Pseudomonas sp. dw_358 TaxID=2720083 RepID=UPI001BD3B738|nr:transglycosylase SLT domain-containing protein [Pseudomonas sp. dw_358]